MPELLLTLLIGAGIGAAVYLALGRFGPRRVARSEGVETLASLRWRDFAHLVLEALRREGYVETDLDRQPGDSGFDFVLTREGQRFLLACKQARGFRLGRPGVLDFAAIMHMHSAKGGVIATLGQVDGLVREVASSNRIEVIDGPRLWTRIAPILGKAAPDGASQRGPASLPKGQQIGIAALAALLVGIAAHALLTPLLDLGGAEAVFPQAASAAAPMPRTAPATTTPVPVATPAEELNDEELATRRHSVVQQIVTLSSIASAAWSSRSTLVVARSDNRRDEPVESPAQEVCRILLQYEEMRFTRLQIDPPPGVNEPVRWRQCR